MYGLILALILVGALTIESPLGLALILGAVVCYAASSTH
jgi:hypothetical protein